jgi:hypothetical protein
MFNHLSRIISQLTFNLSQPHDIIIFRHRFVVVTNEKTVKVINIKTKNDLSQILSATHTYLVGIEISNQDLIDFQS